jgi:DNA-binding transcriptional LysR family regulator
MEPRLPSGEEEAADIPLAVFPVENECVRLPVCEQCAFLVRNPSCSSTGLLEAAPLAGNPDSANYRVSDSAWNHFPGGRRQTANRRSVESSVYVSITAAIVLKLEAARGAASGKNRSD